MNGRLELLKKNLRRKKKLPYLIFDLVNIRYLTGFKGTNGYLLLGEGKNTFISDSRYEEYARSILPGSVEFVLQKGDVALTLKKITRKEGVEKLFLEEHGIHLSTFRHLTSKLKGLELVPGGDDVNDLRIQKDEHEIKILKEAVSIADRCFEHILSLIKPGVLEWDLSVEIEYFYKKNGCTGTSFDSIVASGDGSSMPHYITSMKKRISTGDAVLIDMGCTFRGYNSDLTRTVFVNRVDDDLRKIYTIVRNAQETSIDLIQPGIHTGEIDAKARSVIDKAGFGWAFGHSLGHGVGLEVHEFPALKQGGRIKMREDMVVTVEPGIYIPGKGGVRIEDMVLVTGNGAEILTKSPKDIIVL